jgi:hypothetical protein
MSRAPWPLRSILAGAAGTAALTAFYAVERRRLAEPWASAVFGGVLMTATLTLFPLLGRTPPPWRWPRGFLATSFASHAAYVVAVGLVDDRLARA